METNDFPRDSSGCIADGYNDLYISCQFGNKIYHYGHKVLVAYIPSIQRGHNIIKKMGELNIPIIDYFENDSEVEFRFKSKYIDEVATLLKARTSGAGISPFSSKNLPKDKNIHIPTEYIDEYKAITSRVEKNDLLLIHRFTDEFLATTLNKKYKRIDKNFNYKSDMKRLCLGRQVKEYIYTKEMWPDYLEYLRMKIDAYYN